MAIVQAIPAMPAQGRTLRASTWSPVSGIVRTRPWRSSPLAGPGFSSLPPIIPESSEESLEDPPDGPEFNQTQRSPSSFSTLSDTLATSPSGYASKNTSGSASALMLAEDEASISSISLYASSSTHDTSSHSHGNSQTHSRRPARLLKSPGRRPSSAQGRLSSSNVVETFIAPPPRARTVSHGHLAPPLTSSPTLAIPQAYSPASPSPPMSPQPDTNLPPSTSRDPASNWISSSPFGPAMIPRFSRLTMASPAVVMPLSAREYRKRKARESLGKITEKESPTSSNHVTFTDSAMSKPQTLSGISSSSHCDGPDRQPQPQPQADHPPHVFLSLQPSPPGAKHKRRSRPSTPPRPSPLAAHPPLSPKSSSGTFFSLASASSSDDDIPPPSRTRGTADSDTTQPIPPAQPRLRPRRPKSYPDRLSNGARLSLLEAMNHLSHESTSSHRLSVPSQADGANRLSVASQVSGHTLFFDVESNGDDPVVSEDQDRNGIGASGQQRTSVLATQSLEYLSTLSRTGIEAIHPSSDGNLAIPLDDKRKSKRNVRISDTLEVSPPPGPRRRRLMKSKPTSARASTSGHAPGSATANKMKEQMPTQTHERRVSLLPWKSKGSSSDSKGNAPGAGSGAAGVGADEKYGEDGHLSTPTKGPVYPEETIIPLPVRQSPALVTNGPTYAESPPAVMSNNPIQKSSSAPRRTRYSLSFLSPPTFHRPKREKPNTHLAEADLSPGQYINTGGKPEESSVSGVESGTDSTSTSIRTVTQGSQSTVTSASPGLITVGSSGRRTVSPTVPMLRRLNAQEMATAGVPVQREWDSKGDSTPSLVTNGSTTTSSSVPRTISLHPFIRFPGGEPFVPQPSGLKESFTDTFEEDNLEGVYGDEERERIPAVCVHRKQDQRSSARARGGETPEEDQRGYLRGRSGSGLSTSAGLSPSPRPGTPSSTLTTATETSGSYASFSTVPPSRTSSASTSPSLTMRDKRMSFGGGVKGGGDVCACALCGQLVPGSMSPTRELDQAEMHPMFTVPLVTVPASAMSGVGAYSYTGTGIGNGARHVGRRKSEKHLSVPVSAAATAMNSQGRHHTHANGNEGAPVPAVAAVRTTSPPPSVAKVRKLRRPQTAPPGTGDVASKFIEEMSVLSAREGTVDGRVSVGVGVEGEHLMKHKVGSGSGESKFKTVLKGLLRRRG